jgi:glycosyltransferase involved in cell wall biosynthesis
LRQRLSIVIPAYNEAIRIVPTLEKIRAFLAAEGIPAEILVVNDGSTDDTANVVRAQIARSGSSTTLKLLENPGNRGKGYSVRHGVLEADGDDVLFTDSDLSAPIEEYRKLASAIAGGKVSIAFGSRSLAESKIGRRESRIREYCGRTFNLFVQALAGLPFRDTQCGFKLFTREAARAVFPLQTVDGFGFDVEILFIAKRLGFRMAEVPIEWNHDDRTRVHVLQDGIRMGLDVLKVRWQDLAGKYSYQKGASAYDEARRQH